MKSSEVYTKAAELIESRKKFFACHAIAWATPLSCKIFNIELFREYFDPKVTGWLYWFGQINEENQRARELALYLMAEIAKDME